jgi:hypothetical protein
MSSNFQSGRSAIDEEEAAIEPDRSIVDSGHHLYERGGERYLFHEFLRDLGSGHNIAATVAIEALSMFRAKGPPELRPVGETEFYAGVGAMSASGAYGSTQITAAIVGYADLTLGARVEPVLEAHILAGGGRFRGTRTSAAISLKSYPMPPGVSVEIPPDPARAEGLIAPGALLAPKLQEGLTCLTRLGLSFDVHANHPQLADLLVLARNVPNATIVLNHCGQPLGIGPFTGRQREVFTDWSRSIQALSACPNVFVKLGGLRRCGVLIPKAKEGRVKSQDVANAWRPYLETCIEVFSPSRCMFESNFPPDKAVCEYKVLWNAFKRVSAQYSESEKTDLFAATAARVYRLNDVTTTGVKSNA